MPLYVRFGDETLRDHVDLTAGEFYERLRGTSVQPATSQPTPGDFQEAFEALAEFERIVCITVRKALGHVRVGPTRCGRVPRGIR